MTGVLALIPAHDEESCIAAALAGLHAQTLQPDRIIVVADNCTDRTADIAASLGAEVFRTTGNTGKKAGALNQALSSILPALADDAVVLVQDADSHISPDFLDTAASELSDPRNGAVGGIFYGQKVPVPGQRRQDDEQGGRLRKFFRAQVRSLQAVFWSGRLVGHLQRSEYVRYARQVARNGSRAYVLTGTGTAFRAGVLREVQAGRRRDERLPSGPGDVYDERTMTEDSYMTFAIKTLGYRTPSPVNCWVSTEVMPTWRALWRQRRRWQLGALDNLKAFGPFNRVTRKYTGRQILSFIELLFFGVYVTTAAWSGAEGTFRIIPLWLAIGGLFWLERIISVRKAGKLAMFVASLMVVEVGYGLFLKGVNTSSYWHVIRDREVSWQ